MRLNNMSNYSNKDQTFFKKITLDFNINDSLFKHFNSLPKSQQEAIKQTMILGMLNNK